VKKRSGDARKRGYEREVVKILNRVGHRKLRRNQSQDWKRRIRKNNEGAGKRTGK